MINEAFKQGSSAFIPFIMAGHPNAEASAEAIMALERSGADIIEIGIPFSDPVADGPVNQRAAEIAIEGGMHLGKAIEQVRTVRRLGCKTPIILFSYLNPIIAFGYEKFCEKAKAAGIDGILVVDLPPDERDALYGIAIKEGLEIVLLVSPTTDPKRLPIYMRLGPSFIYYISRLAVTGMQQSLSLSLESELIALRKDLPDTKIAVGFGISSTEQASRVGKIADGVIIGSKVVATLEAEGISGLQSLAGNYAEAIHGHKKIME